MKSTFRRLEPYEDCAGHAVWKEAYDWLQDRGIRQWLVPLPFEAFQKRTHDGRNFGLFGDDSLLAVVALSKFTDAHWIEAIGTETRWWLGALAIRRTVHGRGIGRQVVAHVCVEAEAAGANELYLDCVAGALPHYYSSLGFIQKHAKEITYASGNSFPMVLMSVNLPNRSQKPASPATTIPSAQKSREPNP